jgi:hypothetical protein
MTTEWFGTLSRGELYNQVAVFRSDEYRQGRRDWGSPEELDGVCSAACEAVRVALPTLRRDRRWPMHDRLPAPRDEAFRLRPPDDLSRIDWLYGDSAA